MKSLREKSLGWNITETERAIYRNRSQASSAAKAKALRGEGPPPIHAINVPKLHPEDLMPQLPFHGLRSLSLFSGGGGLDLGFDRAGFTHVASYDILPDAGKTLTQNRPHWTVFAGEAGDVTQIDWRSYRGLVDVIHGGPPCQPFSVAGHQKGKADRRDMFPEFVRAVLEIQPLAFVAENVTALLGKKFSSYIEEEIEKPLSQTYHLIKFILSAPDFGIPQIRNRVFFVGFKPDKIAAKYQPPQPTHYWKKEEESSIRQAIQLDLFSPREPSQLPQCMGIREALGLPDIGFDALAPTIRSGLTGPRHTTSVLSSVSAQKNWEKLQIWPNGVAANREQAHLFVANNGHFRLSVADCAMIQGFPESWRIEGAVYMGLGQIGNAVPPPLAYRVAESIQVSVQADINSGHGCCRVLKVEGQK